MSNTNHYSYIEPQNATLQNGLTQFDFNTLTKSSKYNLATEMYQDHKTNFNDDDYRDSGLKNVFGRYDYTEEPVGKIFFSAKNLKRLQKQLKNEIYNRSNGKFVQDEDQDENDMLIAMRGVYKMYGKFRKDNIIHQVKLLNKQFIEFVVPDVLSEIKQYYGYLKDVNEPLKPIDRPMNVSNAGRRTLPSITTMWTH